MFSTYVISGKLLFKEVNTKKGKHIYRFADGKWIEVLDGFTSLHSIGGIVLAEQHYHYNGSGFKTSIDGFIFTPLELPPNSTKKIFGGFTAHGAVLTSDHTLCYSFDGRLEWVETIRNPNSKSVNAIANSHNIVRDVIFMPDSISNDMQRFDVVKNKSVYHSHLEFLAPNDLQKPVYLIFVEFRNGIASFSRLHDGIVDHSYDGLNWDIYRARTKGIQHILPMTIWSNADENGGVYLADISGTVYYIDSTLCVTQVLVADGSVRDIFYQDGYLIINTRINETIIKVR